MNDIDQSSFEARDDMEMRANVTAWLCAFESKLRSGDAIELASLFVTDGNWRDVLAFTWHLTAKVGADEIARALLARQPAVEANGFKISADRTPPRRVRRLGRACIEAIYSFETRVGRGNGVLRLLPTTEGGGVAGHKAWVISTSLEELKGFEERIGDRRPSGAAYSRNFGGDNWEDVRRKAQSYDGRDPTVLIVGGAQAGLAIAARLNQLGVDNLIVEKWPRIGDSWRKRYHSLALHNSIGVNHLPYLPFPPTWPNYIPKDMLGLWFEFYAQVMEINHWTNTEFTTGVGGAGKAMDRNSQARRRF